MKRSTIAVVAILIIVSVLPVTLSAGGSRERDEQPPAAERVRVRGEVTDVREVNEERTDLTIETPEGTEIVVEIPTRMARNLRVRRGDRFESDERTLARPGERLRVLEFTISRGR